MKKHLVVLSYFILASCYVTYPLVFHLTNTLPHAGDELLITWILNWDIHALLTHPLHIFQAPIFFPYPNTLAYSDAFFSAALLGIIPWLIFQQPAAVYNVNLLFAFASLGFCTYLLVYYLTRSVSAGVISGTVVAFSTYTITKTMHLQLVEIALVPLGLLFFILFAKTKSIKYFFFFCLCLFFQAINSFLPAYFLLFACLILWIWFYFTQKKLFSVFLRKEVFTIGIITAVCLLPFVLPYFQVSRQFNYVRDIRDSIHFANRPEYTLYPSDRSRLQQFFVETIYKDDRGPYKYDGYIGLTFFILLIFSVGYYYTKRKKSLPFFQPFLLISIFGFLLSLGPALQWGGKVLKLPFIIPLPYAFFYYVVPGFNGMRNSSRWEMLFVLAVSISIGIVLASIFAHKGKRWVTLVTIGICMLVLAEIPLPMPLTLLPTKEHMPQTNYFLQMLPEDEAIIEMPSYTWYMSPFANQEFYRLYFSTVDFKPRMNGISGFSPLAWEKDIDMLIREFPNRNSISLLKQNGIRYIVVHADEYTKIAKVKFKVGDVFIKNGKKIIEEIQHNPDIRLVKRINNDYIYMIEE